MTLSHITLSPIRHIIPAEIARSFPNREGFFGVPCGSLDSTPGQFTTGQFTGSSSPMLSNHFYSDESYTDYNFFIRVESLPCRSPAGPLQQQYPDSQTNDPTTTSKDSLNILSAPFWPNYKSTDLSSATATGLLFHARSSVTLLGVKPGATRANGATAFTGSFCNGTCTFS